MKHILILFLSILGMHVLYAQQSNKLTASNNHRQILTHLLQQQSNKEVVLKTTSGTIANRVIAQSTRDNTLATLSDSVKLKYRYFRTSTYDYNTMIYPYNYPYGESPMFNYGSVFTKPQVLYDTFIHWTVNPFTLVYGLYESAYAGYDSATKNLLNYKHVFVDTTTNKSMSYINTFTAANNIASGYWFKLHPASADSAFKQFFTYNASNKLTKDSTYELHLGTWRLVSRTLYTYDVSNNLTQIDNYANTTDTTLTHPLIEQIQYINTYDISGRLLTVLENYYDSMSLSLAAYVKDTFAYSGTNTWHNAWREHQYDPINHYWAPMFNMTKVTNTLGLPDTVNIKSFDSLANSWIPQTMDIIKYDTAHNPDTLWEYDYNFTAFPSTPNYTTVYYYQTYYDTAHPVAVMNNVNAANDRIILFPNPANNTITISRLTAAKYTTLSVSLMNMSGQMVRRESMPWQSEVQISVNDLQPGIYWIVIQDGDGKLLHRQAVVKQ